MDGIIAFCKNPKCGAIFQYKGLVGGTAKVNIKFTDVSVGPCPSCGGTGEIPNGVYEYFDNQLSFIKGPKSSLNALQQVELLLRFLRNNKTSKEDVLNQVKNIAPDVAESFKKVPSKIDYTQWINTFIALVTVLILIQQTYFKDKPESDIKDKFIEHLLKENDELKNKKITPVINKNKIGRNDPCHCGSGIKYKKCHLDLDLDKDR